MLGLVATILFAPPLTTTEWREPDPPLSLGWELLRLPERVVELATAPLAPLVHAVERHRIDRRVVDALKNDAGTIVAFPRLAIGGGDGFGGGAQLKLEDLFGDEEKIDLRTLVRLNLDQKHRVRYRQSVARLGGRELDVSAELEVDRDDKYFGLGNGSVSEDQRALRRQSWEAHARLEIFTEQISTFGDVEIGFLRETLEPGDSDQHAPVGEPGDTVVPPPGFLETNDFVRASVRLSKDSRDHESRPTRGGAAELFVEAITDVEGQDHEALHGEGRMVGHLPIGPQGRTVLIAGGALFSFPFSQDGIVPYPALARLGRTRHLRGYSRDRFADRYAWYATTEYRYPLYEYMSTGVGLSGAYFFDVGRVGAGFDDLAGTPIRWSAGFGIRAEAPRFLIFSFEVGVSPEGPAVTFSLGGESL